MFRHISLFTLKSQPENGKTQAENREALVQMLEALPVMNPAIVHNQVGNALAAPADLPPNGPQFYDVAQMIDFATLEDCLAYPASEGHRILAEFGQGAVAQVACMDFEI